jgi:alpha/beta superfamily hydrolase
MAVTLKNYVLEGPTGQLEGVAHLPDGELRAIAVVAHPLPTMGGTMENKVAVTLAKTFADLGCAAFRFNFRGVGASVGLFTGGACLTEDLIAAVRYAQ